MTTDIAADDDTELEPPVHGRASEAELARLSPQEQRQTLLEVVRLERSRRRALAAVETQGLVGPVTL